MPELSSRLGEARRGPGRHLLSRAPLGLGWIDTALRWQWLNSAMARVFGCTESELVGTSILGPLEQVRPDARDALARALEPDADALRLEIPGPSASAPGNQLTFYPRTGADGRSEGLDVVALDLSRSTTGGRRRDRDRRDGGRGHEQIPSELLGALIDSSPNAAVLVDEGGTIELVNPSAAALFGYPDDELIGAPLELLVPEALRDVHRHLREEYQRDPVARPLGRGRNLLGRHRDGHIIALDIGLSSFQSGGKRLVAAVIVDVSARRAAEAGRLASESRLAHALAAARMVAWEWDLDAGVVTWSANAAEVLGQVPETADAFVAWVESQARPGQRAELDRAVTEGGSCSFEFGVEGTGGQTIWLEGEARVSSGPHDRAALTGVFLDVTARRSAERDVRRVSDTLAAVVAASPSAIVTFDLDGTVQLWNRTAERLLGWRQADVLGRENPATAGERRGEAAQLLCRVTCGETVVNQQASWETRSGRQLVVEISAAPVRDAEGSTIGVVAMIEDVTVRRALEEQLLQGQKMEAIGRLAGSVAHDFNNMLTAIHGFADLLDTDVAAAGVQRESLNGIREAAERASALTRQLLAFGRRQHLEPRVLQLDEVLLGIEPMLRRLIGEDVDLIVSVRPRTGRILADPSQLEQVILNLAVNARDAMPRGGRLTITTDSVDFDEEYTREHCDVTPGQYVELTVSDTGVGMDPEARPHVFEPFFTTKDEGKGTGLGLSTVHGIVRQAGGHIHVSSEPGHGSTFSVYFPTAADGPWLEDRAVATPTAERGSETLLLVEDEKAVRTLMTMALERQGYHVLAAESGEEALAVAAGFEGPIDLLVSDVVMPGMTGPELARALRGPRPGIATLMVSGYTDDVVTSTPGFDAAEAFLPKPFTPEALATRIREVLDAGDRHNVDQGDFGGFPRPAHPAAG